MRILEYKTSRFGGLQDVTRQFSDSLNLILGPNESGKSTIINGIRATLLRGSRVGRHTTEGREFAHKFMPYPDGDTIDGELTFSVSGKTYKLFRQWGNEPQVRLTKPDGAIITNEADVEAILDDLLPQGRHTVQTLVFARQEDLKDILDILRDDATVDSIGSLLRKAVMQLDGVSVDRLSGVLTERSNELLSRWDLSGDCPVGNRGYHNPWKSQVGKILQAYYDKEAICAKINMVVKIEAELTRLQKELAVLQAEKQDKEGELKALSALEGDVFKRAAKEPEYNRLQDEATEIKQVVGTWPLKQREQCQLAGVLQELEARKKALDQELAALQSRARKQQLEQVLRQLVDKETGIDEYQQELDNLPLVTEALVATLDELHGQVLQAEAAMQAGTLLARITAAPELEVFVTKDLDPEQKLDSGDVLVQGFLKLRLGDLAEIEVRAGELDFAQIKDQHQQALDKSQLLLSELKLDMPQAARDVLRSRERLASAISANRQAIESLTDGKGVAELETELAGLKAAVQPRERELVVTEREEVEQKLIDSSAALRNLETTLTQWKQKYGDQEQLFDRLAEIMGDIKLLEKELAPLKPIPPEFSSAEAFSQHLAGLRTRLEEISTSYNDVVKQVYTQEQALPAESLAELQAQHQEAERLFAELKARAQKIIQVQEAFAETATEMDADTFAPLAHSFSKYLARITGGTYKLGHVDDKLNLDLVNKQDKSIPVSLLSSGTYDSTALALRFALLENVFGPTDGMVVLDDCLVDLDPERKLQAVAIIREYARDNQVVFTTCDPQTAAMLKD